MPMQAAWNQVEQAACTTNGSCMPPSSVSKTLVGSPDPEYAASAFATSAGSTTLPSSSMRGSSVSTSRLSGANTSVASRSERSSNASNVPRSWSAYLARAGSDSVSSHS